MRQLFAILAGLVTWVLVFMITLPLPPFTDFDIGIAAVVGCVAGLTVAWLLEGDQ